MLISHSKKFIFIHVNKVAGTSVQSVLKEYNDNGKLGKKYPEHILAKDLKSKLAPEVFNNYFKFGFVRNPWDRQVSLYHFLLRSKKSCYHNLVCSIKNFEGYLEWGGGQCINRKVEFQKDFLCDDDGRILVDFVGKYENLETDFKKVCGLLNINHVKLPHLNKSKHLFYRKYYSSRTLQLVYHRFKPDIDTFDYRF